MRRNVTRGSVVAALLLLSFLPAIAAHVAPLRGSPVGCLPPAVRAYIEGDLPQEALIPGSDAWFRTLEAAAAFAWDDALQGAHGGLHGARRAASAAEPSDETGTTHQVPVGEALKAAWAAHSEAHRRLGDAEAAERRSRYLLAMDDAAATDALRALRQHRGARVRSARRTASPPSAASAPLHHAVVDMSRDALAAARAHPGVRLVEVDERVEATGVAPGAAPTTVPARREEGGWALDRIDQRELPLSSTYSYDDATSSGADVDIYVIDSGVDARNTEFAGRVSLRHAVRAEWGDGSDCNGHGTHVAGLAAGAAFGVARRAHVHAVRVLDCNGGGFVSDILDGVAYVLGDSGAVAPGARRAVVNLSVGGGSTSSTFRGYVDALLTAGIQVVLAAGNSGVPACNSLTASHSGAILVASSDMHDRIASFSNVGSCVDVVAPGSHVHAAAHGWPHGVGVKSMTGTSMSTPLVTGVVARLLHQHPDATAADVKRTLLCATSRGVIVGDRAETPDRLLFIDAAGAPLVRDGDECPPQQPGPAPPAEECDATPEPHGPGTCSCGWTGAPACCQRLSVLDGAFAPGAVAGSASLNNIFSVSVAGAVSYDVFMPLRVDTAATYTISLCGPETNFDTVLRVLSSCPAQGLALTEATVVAYNDDGPSHLCPSSAHRSDFTPSHTVVNLEPGDYWVMVEGYSTSLGSFRLSYEAGDVDQCASSPCLNGGSCINELGRALCDCPAGFGGKRCEVRMQSGCLPNPCQHGGVCAIAGDDGASTCICAEGYTGPWCEVDIDDCAASPCVHGVCTDLVGAFTCTCDDWYSGALCDVTLPQPTPVDCVLGDWSEWGGCSSCTDGQRTRIRSVATPPQGTGAACAGELYEVEECAAQSDACVVDGADDDDDGGGGCPTCWGTTEGPCQAASGVCYSTGHADACPAGTQPCGGGGGGAGGSDCTLGPWSGWSDCTGACPLRDGTRLRHRNVETPAVGGGECARRVQLQPCSGAAQCEGPPAPLLVDGGWSEWSAPGECDASCGDGRAPRTRTCTAPAPANGGAGCPGADADDVPCSAAAQCPGEAVPCEVSTWSSWSTCTATCDAPGQQHRTRSVVVEPTGGLTCPALQRSRDCTASNCPVHGGWSEWSAVGECSHSCGDGVRERQRSCTAPSPANGGNDCAGDNRQWQPCGGECVDCLLSAWAPYGACDAECGGGAQLRTRSVVTHSRGGGAPCGALFQTRGCNNQACSTGGGGGSTSGCEVCWGESRGECRSAFGVCFSTYAGTDICPGGTVRCDDGDGGGGGVETPVACVASDWSEWSTCSSACGGDGAQLRTRSVMTPASGGGASCSPLHETRTCTPPACEPPEGADCLYGAWSEWSTCDGDCTQRRDRSAATVAGEQAECNASVEERPCDTSECADDDDTGVPCAVSPWSEWSSCAPGDAAQTRQRSVVERGTQPCPPLSQFRDDVCVVDCAPGEWGAWSVCSEDCGGGQQHRARAVAVDAVNGGAPCPASALSEARTCNEQACPPPEPEGPGGGGACTACWPGTAGPCRGADTVCWSRGANGQCPPGVSECASARADAVAQCAGGDAGACAGIGGEGAESGTTLLVSATLTGVDAAAVSERRVREAVAAAAANSNVSPERVVLRSVVAAAKRGGDNSGGVDVEVAVDLRSLTAQRARDAEAAVARAVRTGALSDALVQVAIDAGAEEGDAAAMQLSVVAAPSALGAPGSVDTATHDGATNDDGAGNGDAAAQGAQRAPEVRDGDRFNVVLVAAAAGAAAVVAAAAVCLAVARRHVDTKPTKSPATPRSPRTDGAKVRPERRQGHRALDDADDDDVHEVRQAWPASG